MGIVAQDSSKKRTPCPEGLTAAVCCDVVDMGIVDQTYKGVVEKVHKVRIAFLTSKKDEEGQNIIVSVFHRLSMNEKANLRKFMQQWRGKPYTDEQVRAGIDIEKMVGVPALLTIAHRVDGGKVYDNVMAISMLPEEMTAPITPDTYVRVKDRPAKDEQPQGTHRPDAAKRHAEVNANANMAGRIEQERAFERAVEEVEDEDDDLPF